MTLVELRCTRCNAPVEASSDAVLTCRYCGATMERRPVVAMPTAPGHLVYFLKIGRIGPSNRPRVAKVISVHASMSEAAAAKLIETYPSEVPFDREETRANHVAQEIIDAGGQAEVESRYIPGAPMLPGRRISLDAAGPHHVAVIKVVHEYLDLGVLEAKHLVDSAPCVLTDAMEGGRAKSFHDALVQAGAVARIA
jgi:ribosomal protein L7/L12